MYRITGADGKEYGPVSAEQLRQWVAEGRANDQTLVAAEGTTEWKPLSAFPELASSVAPPMRPPVPSASVSNYLVQSILVTICCCVPLGIPAIVFASQVNGKLAAGDVAGAQASAGKAKMWCWIGLGAGLLAGVFYAIIYGAAFIAEIKRVR